MAQVTIESLLPVTEGLKCVECGQHTITLYSKWRDSKNCYFDHKSVCSNCGNTVYPTGVKSFLLEHWDEDIKSILNFRRNRK